MFRTILLATLVILAGCKSNPIVQQALTAASVASPIPPADDEQLSAYLNEAPYK